LIEWEVVGSVVGRELHRGEPMAGGIVPMWTHAETAWINKQGD
jgi:hypothetical protein